MNDSVSPKFNVSRPIGVALIGAGYIAAWHIAALKRIRNVRLVGIFDISQAAAQSLSERFGTSVFADQDEALHS